MDTVPEPHERSLQRIAYMYRVLQACCFVSWGANVIFMIFGVVFMTELGVSLSGIFLLNVLVIVVTFFSSTILNRRSDLLKKRKAFMMLAFVLRTAGIFLLTVGNDIGIFVTYNIVINLLNPISFDVAIVYEIGEAIELLTHEIKGTPVNPNGATRYYLKYRMFGSLGWAFMAPIAGFFIGLLNEQLASGPGFIGTVGGYRIFMLLAFALYATVTVVFMLVYDEARIARVIGASNPARRVETPAAGLEARPRAATNAIASRAFALLLVSIFLFQIGASLFQTPYAIFMKAFSHGNVFYIGISYFCSAILEAPLFPVAFWLIKKRGYGFTLAMAYLVEIARVSLTVLVIPLGIPEIVLPLQMMNSFALRWPSLTHGISVVSHRRKASGINMNLVVEKAGGFVGSVFGTIMAGASDDIGTYNLLFAFSLVFLVSNEIAFSVGSARQGASKKTQRR